MKLCGSDTDKHTKTSEALLDWFCFFPSLTSVAFYNFIEAFLIKKTTTPHCFPIGLWIFRAHMTKCYFSIQRCTQFHYNIYYISLYFSLTKSFVFNFFFWVCVFVLCLKENIVYTTTTPWQNQYLTIITIYTQISH